MSYRVEFTKTLAGENHFDSALIDRLSVPVLYENAIPQFPGDLDLQLEPLRLKPLQLTRHAKLAPARVNWASITFGDEVASCRVGIVCDVHQNSLVLASLLERFAEESVTLLFCLGDYSYTRDPDTKGVRAKQLEKALKLIHQWVLGDPVREAVVLFGNHEIEDWYFGNGPDGRASKEAVRSVVERWTGVERMRFTRDPLSSYEIDNAFDITLYYGRSRRSFRLSHAVTKEFVVALYMGIDASRLEKSRDRIASTFGKSWLEVQSVAYDSVRSRWDRFLATTPRTKERSDVVEEICAYLRSQMTTSSFLESIPKAAGDVYSNARGYLFMLREVLRGCEHSLLAFRLFWGPPLRVETEFTDLEFAYDLRRLYSALGIGRMYSLCGHFHADLGLFKVSQEFGTHMIAVGGLQPRKIIGDSFTAYILECGDETDKLYRLETADDQSLGEFDWDLTYPDWKDL